MSEKPRILVADDEPAITALVSEMLTHSGFEVMTAHGGREAMRIAREGRFDVILLDVMMPDTDGRDACRILKAEPESRDVRVVLFSSADEEDVRWREAGADAFLQKPFSIRSLPEFLRAMLSGGGGA